jgi:hypothetical protein
MRRTYLREQQNILKRQLIHVGAIDLSAGGCGQPQRQTLPVGDQLQMRVDQ